MAAPAASAITSFATPSRNIGCVAANGSLRCDIGRTATPPTPRPPGCELDWGNAFGMSACGPAGRVCHGDTVLPAPGQRIRVVAYGTSIRVGAFRCVSRRVGLTCRNAFARGWTLSRARVRLF